MSVHWFSNHIHWAKAWWSSMAEQLDDLICSYDVPVPEGLDPLSVLLLGWMTFSVLSFLIYKSYKRIRKKGDTDSDQLRARQTSDFQPTTGTTKKRRSENAVECDDVEGVDEAFISKVRSSVPLKEAVSQRASQLLKNGSRDSRAGHPVATGSDNAQVRWVNNVIDFIFQRPDVIDSIAQAWIAALNDCALKQSTEDGVNLQFIGLSRSDTDHCDLTNIVVDTSLTDHLCVSADCRACVRVKTCLTFERSAGGGGLAQYVAHVRQLQGRLHVTVLQHQCMAIVKWNGWPELTVDCELVSDGSASNENNSVAGDHAGSLERRIRDQCARDTVTACLRSAVFDVYYSTFDGFPSPVLATSCSEGEVADGGAAARFKCVSYDPSSAGENDDSGSRRLVVKIIKAAGLGNKTSPAGVLEPFCAVEMDEPSQRFHTQSRASGGCPVWDESFVFHTSSSTCELLFEVFDRQQRDVECVQSMGAGPVQSMGEVDDGRGFLGLGIVAIEELMLSCGQRQIIPLLGRPGHNDSVTGCVTVEFEFVDRVNGVSSSPHHTSSSRVVSARTLNSGELLETTSTTYLRSRDMSDNGVLVTDMALNDLHAVAKSSAKKSTLIIHSSKKECSEPPILKVKPNGDGLWVEVTVKDDEAAASSSVVPARGSSDHTPATSQEAASSCDVAVNSGRLRRAGSRRGSLFGSLRRRLARSRSSDHVAMRSVVPSSGDDQQQKSLTLTRGRHKTRNRLAVPSSVISRTEPAAGISDTLVSDRGGSVCQPGRVPSLVINDGAGCCADRGSISEVSVGSGGSNRTFTDDRSALVLETIENGVIRHFMMPSNAIGKQRIRKKFTKLHVFNEHVFVARHVASGVCAVCERALPRWLGRQCYQCRDCQLIVHKQCHVRVSTHCPDTTVHSMIMEYLPSLTSKRLRNMTR